jgi:hypothetical protein
MIKTGTYDKSLHDKEFKVFLRFSDKSRNAWYFNNKVEPRDIFFKNTLKVFGSENIDIVLDNSSDETYKWFLSPELGLKTDQIERTNFKGMPGEPSSGAFAAMIRSMERAIKKMSPDGIVYLLEDDYIHRKNSKQIILEGLSHFDYVSLSDSFYKYTDRCKDSSIPSMIKVSESCHWKSITTTPSTFACRAEVLKQDFYYFFAHNAERVRHIQRPRPWKPDDDAWEHLTNEGNRTLGCPMPGYSDHINERHRKLHSPFVDWKEELGKDVEFAGIPLDKLVPKKIYKKLKRKRKLKRKSK